MASNSSHSNKEDEDNFLNSDKVVSVISLVENEIKEILIIIQQRSLSKLEDNKRFKSDGIAKFKLKIIGNTNSKLNVNS